jgi:peptidoglycan hydrolase-like protein with peptidoglycan-binding domain
MTKSILCTKYPPHLFSFEVGAVKCLVLAIGFSAFVLLGAGNARAQTSSSVADIIAEITSLQSLSQDAPPQKKLTYLRKLRSLSDQIVEDYPKSEEALKILLEGQAGTVELAVVNKEINALRKTQRDARLAAIGTSYEDIGKGIREEASKEVASSRISDPLVSAELANMNTKAEENTDAEAPKQASVPGQIAANPFSQLNEKEIMRQTQVALNALGCNVGSADGVAGRKTRAGHQSFLKAKGLSNANLPLGSVQLLTTLQSLSGRVCVAPKAIPLGPSNVSGQWSYRSKCGPKSRLPNKTLTGALAIAHRGGGTYSGKIRNSQGFNGSISLRVSGRSVQGNINWGLLIGRTSFTGTVAKDALILYGRDSLGCRMTVSKR